MKDPRYTEAWVDDLAFRIRLRKFEARLNNVDFDQRVPSRGIQESSEAAAEALMPQHIKFSRASPLNLEALRNLPPETNILLFTPVIIPAGEDWDFTHGTMDPFEAFGRALSTYHRRIRHVPYVAKVGFTDMHDAFVSQAEAVITVVCEPETDKHKSVSNQMDFAEAALDSLESKEACASNALILLQCGANEFRLPVDASFMNVIECKNYNADIAKHIARTVFKARV